MNTGFRLIRLPAGSVGLGGCAVAETSLAASAVVEDLDVVEQDGAQLGARNRVP